MGTPSRKRLWLIARSPSVEPDDYTQAMAIAAEQGYDVARVRLTEHHAGGPQDQP
jgi:apolipoprotein D and lipocalin family protein